MARMVEIWMEREDRLKKKVMGATEGRLRAELRPPSALLHFVLRSLYFSIESAVRYRDCSRRRAMSGNFLIQSSEAPGFLFCRSLTI